MDIGCRFYTPSNISDGIANHVGSRGLVVDLFSGSGNLLEAFIRQDYTQKALAFDINPSVLHHTPFNGKVETKIIDCLNPDSIKKGLGNHEKLSISFILNPPFKRISIKKELTCWKNFNNFQPSFFTQRIECVAIAAAIQAAPVGSSLYVIIPEIVLETQGASIFFELLRRHYSLKVVNTYKRARFSSAYVDVVVISLEKSNNKSITQLLKKDSQKQKTTLQAANNKNKLENEFKLFRGKVRPPCERDKQTSVKDLKIGGVNIIGNKTHSDLLDGQISNYSSKGDILLARVGQRMIGRIGVISKHFTITNESILTLRITNSTNRLKVYDYLKSEDFLKWCKTVSRGTANYFITNRDFKTLISDLLQ